MQTDQTYSLSLLNLLKDGFAKQVLSTWLSHIVGAVLQ